MSLHWFRQLAEGLGTVDIGAAFLRSLMLGGIVIQISLSLAYKYVNAAMIAPLNYTALLWTTGFDLVVFHIVPASHVLVGGGVIIASNLFILYREQILSKKQIKTIPSV